MKHINKIKTNCYYYPLLILLLLSGCRNLKKRQDVLFQASTINALLEGVYDGEVRCGKLAHYGDFGIGTFNGLDGEMVYLDSNFYQIKDDGKVYSVIKAAKSPFATVTFFDVDKSIQSDKKLNYDELKSLLNDLLPSKNIFYAIKISGNFRYIKTRSVAKQEKPYPPLAEVAKGQSSFEFHDIKGTMVGFYLPSYMEKINVAGYHFHFIDDDKTAGGHLLACGIDRVTIEVDYSNALHLLLPENSEFYTLDLNKNRKEELEQIEK